MKRRSKFLKIFTIFTSFLFMMFLSCSVVDAEYYQASENTFKDFTVHKNENKVSITFEYQNGITDIEVYVCNPGECTNTTKALTTFKAEYKNAENKYVPIESINSGSGKKIYNITLTQSDMTEGIPFTSYSDKYKDSKLDTEYEILVKAKFCVMRSADHRTCSAWEESQTDFNGARKFDMETGLTPSSELNNTIGEILTIVNNYVIPALWIILGILLIVRGILLGIDIVKASDEPEVRQKKIHGLIWLAIGIFVSYIVTFAASYVMSLFGYGGYF